MKDRMTTKEGAKLLKQTLCREFPGTKFSVTMSRGTKITFGTDHHEHDEPQPWKRGIR